MINILHILMNICTCMWREVCIQCRLMVNVFLINVPSFLVIEGYSLLNIVCLDYIAILTQEYPVSASQVLGLQQLHHLLGFSFNFQDWGQSSSLYNMNFTHSQILGPKSQSLSNTETFLILQLTYLAFFSQ